MHRPARPKQICSCLAVSHGECNVVLVACRRKSLQLKACHPACKWWRRLVTKRRRLSQNGYEVYHMDTSYHPCKKRRNKMASKLANPHSQCHRASGLQRNRYSINVIDNFNLQLWKRVGPTPIRRFLHQRDACSEYEVRAA